MKFYWFIALTVLFVSGVRAQTNTTTATNTTAIKPAPRQPTRITSDRGVFDMNKHQAVYEGHVRVDSDEMKLTCEWLTANLPASGGRPDHIICETNVVIDFSDERGQTNHVTSEKAVYDFHIQNGVTNETVTMTGEPKPKVENPQSIITADVIVWDRANNRFQFTNQKMIFRQSLDVSPMKAGPAPAKTNAMPRKK